ncbi:MAG: hypothetical protein RL131_1428 [Bacteroidota bacterium]
MKWIKPLGIILLILVTIIAFNYKNDLTHDLVKSKYANESSKFMSLLGMNVHYRDEGILNDTLPLVMIHGLSSSLHTWDSLAVRIKDKKRIIRMDLPGFGLTGPNPERDYSIVYFNRFIDSFLNKLQIKQCILVGNSLGGNIAWNQSLLTPEKVHAIVLINSAGYPRKNEKGNLGFKLASIPVLNSLITKITPKSLIKKSLEDAYFDKTKIQPELVDRYYDLLLHEGNRKATLDLFKQRKFPSSENIKNVNCPTLIIWGQNDQMIDVENAYKFNSDIKNSQLKIIPSSGHVPMEETPDEVYKSILSFINWR